MSKVTLLGAFLAILTLSIACSDDDSQPAATATATATGTGIDRLDLVIDRLLAKDVEGLVELVEFTPRGCVERSTVGAPPTCEPGQEVGSPVSTFALGYCEGAFVTTIDAVRHLFDRALADSDELSLYAVLRGEYFDRPEEGYGVAVAEGITPTAPGLLWHVTGEGRIDSLSFGCGLPGIAEMVNLAMPSAEYVIGPLLTCSPGPGETVDLIVNVEGVGGGVSTGQVDGPASTTARQPTGERAIVHVTLETQWEGRIRSFDKVRVGMVLQVTGERQDDCSIVASNISALEPPVTGIDRLDLVIDRLLAKDVEGLVELVEFTPRGCVERSTVGAPPTCEPGQEVGSPVSTFATGGCEGTFLTDIEEVREHFDRVLAASDELSLYAVLRWEEGYVIAVTPGSLTSSSLPGQLWWVSDQGTVERLSLRCGDGVAERIALALPEAEYLVGPLQGECRPGPGEVADFLVDIESFATAGFFGPVSPVQGRPTGEIVRVFVNSDTQLDGGPGGRILSILKLRMQVRVTGQRQDDCSIVAANVSTLDTPTRGN